MSSSTIAPPPPGPVPVLSAETFDQVVATYSNVAVLEGTPVDPIGTTLVETPGTTINGKPAQWLTIEDGIRRMFLYTAAPCSYEWCKGHPLDGEADSWTELSHTGELGREERTGDRFGLGRECERLG